MANPVFSARFIPGSATTVDAITFDTDGVIFDGNGLFSAADIQVDDIVYLDCYASLTSPGTVSRYVVTQINSQSGFSCNLRLEYADTGDPIDPNEISGSAGFIARPSALNALAYYAAPTVHTIPDYVIQHARNQDNILIVDPGLNAGGGGNPHQKTMIGNAAIAAGKPIAKLANGKAAQADSDGAGGLQNICGYAMTACSGDNAAFEVLLIGPNLAGALTGLGFTPGQDVFISEDGGYTNDANSFTGANDSIIRAGVADCAANTATGTVVDLIVFTEVILRP
jgi:hypothetical protein